jgi:hypothetical protein
MTFADEFLSLFHRPERWNGQLVHYSSSKIVTFRTALATGTLTNEPIAAHMQMFALRAVITFAFGFLQVTTDSNHTKHIDLEWKSGRTTTRFEIDRMKKTRLFRRR